MRKAEGKAAGLDEVTTTLEDVSVYHCQDAIALKCLKTSLTFVLRATDITVEVSFPTSVGLKQIAAICAKHQ